MRKRSPTPDPPEQLPVAQAVELGYTDPPHPSAEELAEVSEELPFEEAKLEAAAEVAMEAALKRALHDLALERAAFANFRQRVDKDKAEIAKYGGIELARDLVRVLDYFEMSLTFDLPDLTPAAANIIEGVKYTVTELHKLLEQHGVKAIETAGGFDPASMEAIGAEERADVAPGTVLNVATTGYRYKERVLRPARVVVAKLPAESGEGSGVAEE